MTSVNLENVQTRREVRKLHYDCDDDDSYGCQVLLNSHMAVKKKILMMILVMVMMMTLDYEDDSNGCQVLLYKTCSTLTWR